MSQASQTGCRECRRLREELEASGKRIEELERQLAQARKDSSTSSKPPSSDIVKPPKPAPTAPDGKRKIGAQTGHPKHERVPFSCEQLTAPAREHRLDQCPDCGGALLEPGPDKRPRVQQQVEVLDVPLRIEEHRALPSFCPACDRLHYAPLPDEVQAAGLVGPRLTALVAFMKGPCHASYSTIRIFLRDVVGVTVSRGHLANLIGKVSEALDKPYDELLKALPGQGILNIDETGHKVNGDLFWTWCFRASLFTLFKIDPRRSADVLIKALGEEFDGVIGCDCFSAYKRFRREFDVRVQFCLAHLIRDVKYLTTLTNKQDRGYGERLLWSLKRLFKVIHKKGELSEKDFKEQLQEAKEMVLLMGRVEAYGPESATMACRLETFGEAYFQFLLTPGLEPTNNSAEQAIRFVVIDRRVTQGTRGKKGNHWSERIWTIAASCAQQGKSVFGFLAAAVLASFTGAEAPSLLR
jgi:transposase